MCCTVGEAGSLIEHFKEGGHLLVNYLLSLGDSMTQTSVFKVCVWHLGVLGSYTWLHELYVRSCELPDNAAALGHLIKIRQQLVWR